eukprot:TRINITY_DN20655_c0_g1_i1.p1 TRINITY_DN20655_c0_g1~~TRINITY_DN20655_c0_g1_i1.p1  ORF type:complete len:494 (+),score=97.19 TRINITY_DN20655_c0_g1_i1:389-1870(+)
MMQTSGVGTVTTADAAVAAVGLAPEVRRRIEILAEHVGRNGIEFEHTVRQKNASNTQFAFLAGGEGAEYYSQLLQMHQANRRAAATLACAAGPHTVAVAAGQAEVSDLAELVRRWREPQAPPLPQDADRQLGEIFSSLEAVASRDAIRNGRSWIESNVAIVTAVAAGLMRRIVTLPTCAHRLHVLFLLHDVLQTEATKLDSPNRPMSVAFKPFLPWTLRPVYQLAESAAPGGDEGGKVLKLLQIWGDRGIVSAREAEEIRSLVVARDLPATGVVASAAGVAGGGMLLRQVGGLHAFPSPTPAVVRAGMLPAQTLAISPLPGGVHAQRPLGVPGQTPFSALQSWRPGLAASGTLPARGAQTPETVPVGVMASLLKQVSRRGKDLHTAFVPYKPLDPLYTPQTLPGVPPPTERLMERLREYYDLVGDAAKPPHAAPLALPAPMGAAGDKGVATAGRSRSRSPRNGGGSGESIALPPSESQMQKSATFCAVPPPVD